MVKIKIKFIQTVVLLFIGTLIILQTRGKKMDKYEMTISIRGEKVTKSFISDPFISHGNFLIENNGEYDVNLSVKTVILKIENDYYPIKESSLFNMTNEIALNPHNFIIEAHTKMRAVLGFPRIPFEGNLSESIAVEAVFLFNGKELTAVSKIELIRRIP